MSENAIKNSIFSSTMPVIPETNIESSHLVKYISNMFSPKRVSIVVEGLDFSGKTQLLAQFARYYAPNCFSFFLTDSYLNSNILRFLIDMCEQIGNMMGMDGVQFDNMDEHQLKYTFTRLYTKLCKQSSNKGPYFFVIDGLDHIQDKEFFKLIPSGDPKGIFVLMSSTPDKEYPINYETMIIQEFSEDDSRKYFSDLEIMEQDVMKIHEASNGMPGYLSEIRRLLDNGSSIEEVISDLPNGFNALIDKEWEKITFDETTKMLLGVIAFGQENFFINDLSNILEKSTNIIKACLEQIKFIKVKEKTSIVILNIYKNYIQNKLLDLKPEILNLLISYYMKYPKNERSLLYLSAIYKEQNDALALNSLLSNDNVIDILTKTRQISVIRKGYKTLANIATGNKNWQLLINAALTDSLFSNVLVYPSFLKDEVEALLSLGRIKEAINISLCCTLPEDRLLLIGRVCNYLKRKELSIEKSLLDAIEDSVNLLDINNEMHDEYIDKMLDICSDLLVVSTDYVSTIFNKIIEHSNIKLPKGRLIDLLMMMLIKRVGKEAESVEDIKRQINNAALIDFVYHGSEIYSQMNVEELLQKVEDVEDTSTKIYFIRAWCNNNLKNYEAYKVIEQALKIMVSATDYEPTVLHLRQIANPLVYCEDKEKALELIGQFDLLLNTALPNPKDERSWVELILATVEKKWEIDNAMLRFYSLYYSLEDENDLDIRCYVLARILTNLTNITQEIGLEEEIEKQLINEYEALLSNSAEQLKIVRKLLRITSTYSINLALSLAQKLNAEQRRDLALCDISLASIYENSSEDIIHQILNIIKYIEDQDLKEWIFVKCLIKLHTFGLVINEAYQQEVNEFILAISSPSGKALGLTYFLLITSYVNKDKITSEIGESIKLIDSITERIYIGFQTVSLLANSHKRFSEDLFENIRDLRVSHPLADARFRHLYSKSCRLAIRMMPAFYQSPEYNEYLNLIIQSIRLMNSSKAKCAFYSDLALRCLAYGDKDTFADLAKECHSIIDKTLSLETKALCIINSCALLFAYEREILFEKLGEISTVYADIACMIVIDYLISKRPPSDDVDLKSASKEIDYADAQAIISVIKHINTDNLIYEAINLLVKHITIEQNWKLVTNLTEKQCVFIVEELEKIIINKLPDGRNIQHEGYIIACNTCIAVLRDAVIKGHHRSDKWKSVPSWPDLERQIDKLENSADKVFVYEIAAVSSYESKNKGVSQGLIAKAQNALEDINNHVDRANRYSIVAEGHQQISNLEAAKFFVSETVKLAQICSSEEGRDKILGGAIELAHSIDPDYASNLTNTIENKLSQVKLKEDILALDYHSDPKKAIDSSHYIRTVTNRVSKKVTRSLCSGRGTIQHAEVIAQWVIKSLGLDFDTISSCATWYIENTLATNKHRIQGAGNDLNALLQGTFSLIKLIFALSFQMTPPTEVIQPSIYSVMSSRKKHFSIGEGKKALDYIYNWVSKNALSYTTIYDPYFRSSDLPILKSVPSHCRVTILLSTKTSELEGIKDIFKIAWKNICDQIPPDTVVYAFATENGKTPLHDRYIICDESGLNPGVSFNGWGSNNSSITPLDLDDKLKIEQDEINTLILNPPKEYKGQRLIQKRFDLS